MKAEVVKYFKYLPYLFLVKNRASDYEKFGNSSIFLSRVSKKIGLINKAALVTQYLGGTYPPSPQFGLFVQYI